MMSINPYPVGRSSIWAQTGQKISLLPNYNNNKSIFFITGKYRVKVIYPTFWIIFGAWNTSVVFSAKLLRCSSAAQCRHGVCRCFLVTHKRRSSFLSNDSKHLKITRQPFAGPFQSPFQPNPLYDAYLGRELRHSGRV